MKGFFFLKSIFFLKFICFKMNFLFGNNLFHETLTKKHFSLFFFFYTGVDNQRIEEVYL